MRLLSQRPAAVGLPELVREPLPDTIVPGQGAAAKVAEALMHTIAVHS